MFLAVPKSSLSALVSNLCIQFEFIVFNLDLFAMKLFPLLVSFSLTLATTCAEVHCPNVVKQLQACCPMGLIGILSNSQAGWLCAKFPP